MIKILIVTDVRLWRDGLTEALGRRSNLHVIDAIPSSSCSIIETHRPTPDIILLDMTIADAARTVQVVSDARPGVGLVGVGVREEEEDVLRCLELGIRGYVSREGSIEDLVRAIEGVTRGEMLCSPRITAALARRLNVLSTAQNTPTKHLSYREKQITGLVDQGLSNKEIAGRLHITLATVKNHVHNVLRKLHVRSRREVARKLNLRTHQSEATI